ncbi:MAG TPA: ParB/RepB/Spo0J family partition protein [Candidatus Atribacteria bacterium]|nr:ParB/RepB/Spo0J family partition protein [Candidatus Atribacteria bacterium]
MVKRGLGKGIEALIPKVDSARKEFITEIDIDDLAPNIFQPRKDFDREKMEELKESIKKHGMIQPIVVREIATGYELVAGERRLRAAKEIGMKRIPAIIKNFSNEKSLEIALVENIQREDLNPIEQANAFKRLADEFKLTQQELADVTGKSRSLISNTIRLLKLDPDIQRNIAEGKISFGHAKLLLGIEDEEMQRIISDRIISSDLSVRATEKLIKIITQRKQKQFKVKNITIEHFPEAEEKLREILGTKVNILYDGKKGKINIEFYTKEDLRRIIDLFLKQNN